MSLSELCCLALCLPHPLCALLVYLLSRSPNPLYDPSLCAALLYSSFGYSQSRHGATSVCVSAHGSVVRTFGHAACRDETTYNSGGALSAEHNTTARARMQSTTNSRLPSSPDPLAYWMLLHVLAPSITLVVRACCAMCWCTAYVYVHTATDWRAHAPCTVHRAPRPCPQFSVCSPRSHLGPYRPRLAYAPLFIQILSAFALSITYCYCTVDVISL